MAEASKTGSGQTGIFSSSLTLNIVLFYRNSTVSYGGKKNHIMLIKDSDGKDDNQKCYQKKKKSHFIQWFEIFCLHLIQGFVWSS